MNFVLAKYTASHDTTIGASLPNSQNVAQAIILGCTEISLLVNQLDADVPLFDTAHFYARGTAARA